MYKIQLSLDAEKDYKKLKKSRFVPKYEILKDGLSKNPYELPCKKLKGREKDFYSKRINKQHRLVYEIDEVNKVVIIRAMWSHYGD
jgi:Txe/YoeB family toxin of toxin-antitoxin system